MLYPEDALFGRGRAVIERLCFRLGDHAIIGSMDDENRPINLPHGSDWGHAVEGDTGEHFGSAIDRDWVVDPGITEPFGGDMVQGVKGGVEDSKTNTLILLHSLNSHGCPHGSSQNHEGRPCYSLG